MERDCIRKGWLRSKVCLVPWSAPDFILISVCYHCIWHQNPNLSQIRQFKSPVDHFDCDKRTHWAFAFRTVLIPKPTKTFISEPVGIGPSYWDNTFCTSSLPKCFTNILPLVHLGTRKGRTAWLRTGCVNCSPVSSARIHENEIVFRIKPSGFQGIRSHMPGAEWCKAHEFRQLLFLGPASLHDFPPADFYKHSLLLFHLLVSVAFSNFNFSGQIFRVD